MKVFDAKEGKEIEVSENDLPQIAASDSLRKASGSQQTGFDPEISEWGNPTEW